MLETSDFLKEDDAESAVSACDEGPGGSGDDGRRRSGANERGRRLGGLLLSLALHLAVCLTLVQYWNFGGQLAMPPEPHLVAFDVPPPPPPPPAAPEPVPMPKVFAPVPRASQPAPDIPAVETVLPLHTVAIPSTSSMRGDPAIMAPLQNFAPVPSIKTDGKDSFEGRLLARLEQFRRYPEEARRRQQQGVVHVRFQMNRKGSVLDASVARSSGIPSLDREALATVRRAQPLPAIPDDRPDMLTISVPIEFFLRRSLPELAQVR